MKSGWRVLLAVLLGVLLGGAQASDDSGSSDAKKHKRKYAELDAQLMELDKDHDGKLDHGELIGALHALKKIRDAVVTGQVDADKDGKIDHHELKKFLDADKDGKIDHGELRRYLVSIKTGHPGIYAKIVAEDTPKEHRRTEKK